MNPENTSLPFPPHVPPAAPEGMKWEYVGTNYHVEYGVVITYYCVRPDFTVSRVYLMDGLTGREGYHYFEAVPILKDSGFWQEVQSKEPWSDGLGGTENPIGIDPKGEAGAKKAPLCLLPSFPLHETSWVLDSGRRKYGIFNWRSNKVCASTYRSAMQRHLDQWFDGLEDADAETSRSHLAHVIASACIVMDAAKHGTLVDDRPVKPVKETLTPEQIRKLLDPRNNEY